VRAWFTVVRSTAGPFSRIYNSTAQYSTVQITLELVKAEIGERVQWSNMTECGPVTHPGHEVWKAQVRPHDLLEHGLSVATVGREVGAIGESKKGQGKDVIDHNK
jgi:hypothetical protein